MRWRADTPLGDVYSTRPDASRRITPSPTRGASSRLDVLRVEREVAGRDHAGEAVEDVDVGALELAGLATERRRRLPGEHADHLAAAAHRDGQHPHPLLQRRDGGLPLDDLAEPERPGDERPLLLVDDGADPVGPVHGLGGGGPDLGEDEEPLAVLGVDGGREEEEVGEAEVGEQAPAGDEALEVVDGPAVERGVEAGELRERGHGPLRLRSAG